MRPRQNGRHFADDIFKCIFSNENVWIPIKISIKFVPKGPINNIPALVQIMAWCHPGDKPLSEPMLVSVPTHICVTRPQWVKCTTYCLSLALRNAIMNPNVIYIALTYQKNVFFVWKTIVISHLLHDMNSFLIMQDIYFESYCWCHSSSVLYSVNELAIQQTCLCVRYHETQYRIYSAISHIIYIRWCFAHHRSVDYSDVPTIIRQGCFSGTRISVLPWCHRSNPVEYG